ncbi:putative RNA recognition motif domain, nucleotide-binding alpha-beta plait domain superfamily [Helianthus anomalus]
MKGRGNSRQREQSWGKNMERKINTFFVANLPNGCTTKDLETTYKEYGEVTRTFVAQKKDKVGRVFGFVDFMGEQAVEYLDNTLKNVTILGRSVFFKQARFEKGAPPPPPSKITGDTNRQPKYRFDKNTCLFNGKSFASILSGKSSDYLDDVDINIPHNFRPAGSILGSGLVGRVVDFTTLRTLHYIAKEAGIQDCEIKYLGGLYLLLHFKGSYNKNEFLENRSQWGEWFSFLDDWTGQSLSFEGIAWLRIYGVPPHLNDGNWTYDYIGVLKEDGFLINDKITIKWKDKSFRCCVVEEQGDWLSDFLEGWESDGDQSLNQEHCESNHDDDNVIISDQHMP